MTKDNDLQALVHEAYKNIRDMVLHNKNEFNAIFEEGLTAYRDQKYSAAVEKFTDAIGIIDTAEATKALIVSLKWTLTYDLPLEERAGKISRILSLCEKQISMWPDPKNYSLYIVLLLSKEVNNEKLTLMGKAIEIGEEGVKKFPYSRDLHVIMNKVYRIVKDDLSSHISMLRACDNSLYDFKFLEKSFGDKLLEHMPGSDKESTVPINYIWGNLKKFENNPLFLEQLLMFEQNHNYGGFPHRNGIMNMLLTLLNKSYPPNTLIDKIIPKEIELSPEHKGFLTELKTNLKTSNNDPISNKENSVEENDLPLLEASNEDKGKKTKTKRKKGYEKESLEKTIDLSLTPKSLKAELDKYVIGQDDAKRIIANALYNHYLRVNSNDPKWKKGNIILIGPTGCGKTLIATQIARILDVPFAVGDCTAMSEVGYVGNDADEVLKSLYYDAKYKNKDINTGIIYLDEVDKIAVAQDGFGRDVRGRGVQQPFLKMVEGQRYRIGLGRNGTGQQFEIDTTPVLFIAGGSFAGDSGKTGLLELAYDTKTEKGKIGFNQAERVRKEDVHLYYPTDQDMKQFGLIPEFIGRFPIRSFLRELTEEQLAEIMVKPENATLKQKQEFFKAFGVDLTITEDAIKLIAAEAKKSSTGARSLDSIMNTVLNGLEYELPGSGVKSFEVTKQFVEEKIAAK